MSSRELRGNPSFGRRFSKISTLCSRSISSPVAEIPISGKLTPFSAKSAPPAEHRRSREQVSCSARKENLSSCMVIVDLFRSQWLPLRSQGVCRVPEQSSRLVSRARASRAYDVVRQGWNRPRKNDDMVPFAPRLKVFQSRGKVEQLAKGLERLRDIVSRGKRLVRFCRLDLSVLNCTTGRVKPINSGDEQLNMS